MFLWSLWINLFIDLFLSYWLKKKYIFFFLYFILFYCKVIHSRENFMVHKPSTVGHSNIDTLYCFAAVITVKYCLKYTHIYSTQKQICKVDLWNLRKIRLFKLKSECFFLSPLMNLWVSDLQNLLPTLMIWIVHFKVRKVTNINQTWTQKYSPYMGKNAG